MNRHIRSPLLGLAAMAAVVGSACGAASTSQPVRGGPAVHTPTAPPTPPPLAAPLMVQIENHSAARPQSGLNLADVVYEYETEGGISRFSALYFQPPNGQVGPVRSARLATIRLLSVYNATLLYSGGSDYIVQTLKQIGVRQFDEDTSQGALFRVNNRYAPHNLYTDGAHIAALEQRIGPHTASYQLWGRTPQAALPPGGSPLPSFSVPVSQQEHPVFTYQPASGTYVRTEPDTGPLADADTGAPWQVGTIVVLPVQVTVGPEVEDVSGAHGLDFAVVGGGAGQLAVGGQLYPVTWTQTGSGPPQLSLPATGKPAPVVPGQVLIELVAAGQAVQPA